MSQSPKWFVKKRGSYLPASWQGWLTYIPFIAYLVLSYVVISSHIPSVALAAFSLVPQWVAATVILTWVAQHTS